MPYLNRICTEDFPVPNSEYTIKKGTPIVISLIGMGRDPKYFKDADKFIPERHDKNNTEYEFNPNANIPFGIGPRACVGKYIWRHNKFLFILSI